jgi:crossover junction endodeoxyribonuclease RuvC
VIGELHRGDQRILGVDPGSICTGWGLIGGPSSKPVVLDRGVIRLDKTLDIAQRLWGLHHQLETLVLRLQPTSAAVESPFTGVNPRSALQLAHARGVILAALASAGLSVAEYSPATVKKSVTGNGRADKTQVAGMVCRLLRVELVRQSHDLSDALAVALCHLSSRGLAEAVRRSIGR